MRTAVISTVMGIALIASACGTKTEERVTEPSEVSLSFGFELEVEDDARTVGEDFRFQDDDRFRLRVESDFEAYLYIFNHEAKSDTAVVLFPDRRGSNPLVAHREVVEPEPPSWFRMDRDSGGENLVLVASRRPLRLFEDLRLGDDIPLDEFETALADVERTGRPDSMRRFKDGPTTRILAADSGDHLVLVVRVPLQHEQG